MYDKIKDDIRYILDNNSAHSVAIKIGLTTSSSINKYKKGTAKIENMPLGVALKIAKLKKED